MAPRAQRREAAIEASDEGRDATWWGDYDHEPTWGFDCDFFETFALDNGGWRPAPPPPFTMADVVRRALRE